MTLTHAVSTIRRTWQARWLPPLAPLLVVALLLVCAVGAPLLAPHSPIDGSLGKRLHPPAGMEAWDPEHLLGTDRLGRDTLSRLVYGARISLSVSLLGIVLTGAIGGFIGLLAGFWGRRARCGQTRHHDPRTGPAPVRAVLRRDAGDEVDHLGPE